MEVEFNRRVKGESTRAFRAFLKYRDFGYQRSLIKVLRKLKSIPEGQSFAVPGYWNDWSKKYEWTARANAFDAEQDRIEQNLRDKLTAKLAGQRQEFEVERQKAKQQRILEIDVVLNKYQQEAALSIRDLTQEKTITEMVAGKPRVTHTVTRFRAIKGGDFAKVAKVQGELEGQAINGMRVQPRDGTPGAPAEPKAIIPEWLVQDLRAQSEVMESAPVEAKPAPGKQPVQ